MNRIALLLRKDVLVLRRSPLLLGILLAYPLAIAVLVGLVASYASSKPRVAFVDEDNLPPTVIVGGKRFHVDRTIREVSQNVKLVRLSPEAARQLSTGGVVAVVTVPPGFIASLKGMVKSPQLELQLSKGTLSSRVEQHESPGLRPDAILVVRAQYTLLLEPLDGVGDGVDVTA